MANTTPNLVRKLPSGRLSIEIDRRIDGKRTRIRRVLPEGTSMNTAAAIAHRLDAETRINAVAVSAADGWDAYVDSLPASKGGWLYVSVQNMRHRAKEKGMECALTVAQLRDVLRRSRGRCAVTGLRFTTSKEEGARTRPYFHSVDRIDSSKGYMVENVRMVCHATNIAMNTWGDAVFAELARGFVFNRYGAFYTAEIA